MDTERNELDVPIARWNRKSERCNVKGPLRVIRLCLLAICLPGALVAVPLYLRYRVYSEQTVPLGMSDMRLLDNKISTTWCQGQLIRSNATFNAYLVPERPPVQRDPKFVTMVREIVLEDDMKEYWGFYLLKGSTVTVSTCCRRPGASLIVIKGHRHLRACTYIGDDSSEEEEELNEINEIAAVNAENKNKSFSIPKAMQRARSDIVFRGNDHRGSSERKIISNELDLKDTGDDVDLDLVAAHNHKMKHPVKAVGEISRLHHVSHERHYHGREEHRGYDKVDSRASEEVLKAAVKKLKSYKSEGKDVMKELILKLKLDARKENDTRNLLRQLLEGNDRQLVKKNESESFGAKERHARNIRILQKHLNQHDEDGNAAEEEGVEHQEVQGTINGTTSNDTSNSEFWSSFSSSEERLLECAGLIMSQPLVPSSACRRSHPKDELDRICKEQQFSYTVPGNGYYFFVFSSENEVQPNYIRAHFQLEKIVYNVSNRVAACENSTEQCSLPLNFFSKEKLVLELPVNDSQWNTEFLIVSTCEPRTMLYAICIIAIPILILLCAY